MIPKELNAIEMAIRFLEESFGGYAAVVILLTVYLIIQVWMKRILQRESDKRKQLLVKLDEVKNQYLINEKKMEESDAVNAIDAKFDNLQTTMRGVGVEEQSPSYRKIQIVRDALKELFLKNNYLKTIHVQGALTEDELDQLIEESKEAKRASAVRPGLHIFSFIFPIVLFVTLLLHLYVITSVPFHIVLPISTAIVTFFTNVTRKRVWIFAALAVVLFLIYKELSGAANLFILLYFIYRFVNKRVMVRRKKAETNG